MKITPEEFSILKRTPNSAYTAIMSEFLFHSNKLEGSTFSEAELERLIFEGRVEGSHTMDDVLETKNSVDVFAYLVDTLGTPIDDSMLWTMNAMLFKGTSDELDGFTGHYKTIANRIAGSSVQVALPSDMPIALSTLLAEYAARPLGFEDIVDFHVRFEHLHPFQNGNGRIGRFLMLKQCVESDVDIIVIDDENERPYKAWFKHAQTEGGPRFLYDLMRECQKRFDAKMERKGVKRLVDDLRRARETAD